MLAADEGRLQDGLDLDRRAVDAARGFPQLEVDFSLSLCKLHLEAGDVPGARCALDFAESRTPVGGLRFSMLVSKARVLVAEGDASDAKAALDEAEALARQLDLGRMWHVAKSLAQVRTLIENARA